MDYPKRKINRLQNYYYNTPNAYFLTICTVGKQKMFWSHDNVVADCPQAVPLSETGIVVRQCVERIPTVYPTVTLDHYVIMPNHIHMLLQINTDCSGRLITAPTISTVVRLMKRAVSKSIGHSIWQKGFYDHIIRNDVDYRNIWNYIEGNPSKWFEDDLYM